MKGYETISVDFLLEAARTSHAVKLWSCDDGEGTPVRGSDRQESPAEKISIAGMIHLIRISEKISYYIYISIIFLLVDWLELNWIFDNESLCLTCDSVVSDFFFALEAALGIGGDRMMPFNPILSHSFFYCVLMFWCVLLPGSRWGWCAPRHEDGWSTDREWVSVALPIPRWLKVEEQTGAKRGRRCELM